MQEQCTPKWSELYKRIRKYRAAYLMFLPVAAWYIIFKYIPMGGLVIAFQKYSPIKGIAGSKWVGIKNFQTLITNESFLNSVKNTLIISCEKLVLTFPLPIFFALLLNEMRALRFKKLVQTVSYLPHFISWSVAGGIIYMLLSPSSGVIPHIVKSFGGKTINYLGTTSAFRPILIISSVWKALGWSAIVYLAAIAGINEQLYDAAEVDGAGRWQKMWHVTLPGIRPIIAFKLIMNIGNIFDVSFDQVFMLVNDMTQSVGETIDYYIYRVGLTTANNFSLATASGLMKSLIGLALVFLANGISKRLTDGEAGIW